MGEAVVLHYIGKLVELLTIIPLGFNFTLAQSMVIALRYNLVNRPLRHIWGIVFSYKKFLQFFGPTSDQCATVITDHNEFI